jgi:hypothetical protein
MKPQLIIGIFTVLMSLFYAWHDYNVIKKEVIITREMHFGRFIERFALAAFFMLILQKAYDFSFIKYCVGLLSIGVGFWFWFDLYLNSMRGKKWYYTGENSVLDRFKSESPKVINICILLTYSLLFTLFVILK